jgi:hypothetical protein
MQMDDAIKFRSAVESKDVPYPREEVVRLASRHHCYYVLMHLDVSLVWAEDNVVVGVDYRNDWVGIY